jgi:hypothetical protein
LLATIFAGIEDHPAGYKPGPAGFDANGNPQGDPIVISIPMAGTTFVAGMNAFLNISYTFIGQITLPSFIAEMRDPREFPKALWAITIAEVFLFGISGAVIFAYTGYVTSPSGLPNILLIKVNIVSSTIRRQHSVV